jgi:c-di-GMP-binding flagellar brake protein YcgR
MNAERRRTLRLHPKELTFVVMRPQFSKSGKILDISRGGLCFQYLYLFKSNPSEGGAASVKIDIFIINNGYYLPKVPCKLIYDVEKKEATSSPMSLGIRRCGLQFGELSKEQNRQMELYLNNYTEVME